MNLVANGANLGLETRVLFRLADFQLTSPIFERALNFSRISMRLPQHPLRLGPHTRRKAQQLTQPCSDALYSRQHRSRPSMSLAATSAH